MEITKTIERDNWELMVPGRIDGAAANQLGVEVLAAKCFSHEHGQTTLLDLLDAQRADNQIHQSCNDALGDAAKALIELERAAGIWDIAF